MVMGGYWEWKHLSEAGVINHGDQFQQELTLHKTLNQITKAKSISNRLLCEWGSNLDMIPENDTSNRYNIKNMLEYYNNFMNDQDSC